MIRCTVPGAGTNFMVETRAQDLPGPDGILGTADDVHQYINQDTPFVDQSQTYASDPSHQVFLREYMIGADGKLHSTGALLGHHDAGKDGILGNADDPKVTMATWADLKTNAATFLGLKITDYDVGNVPVLTIDAYGNFIRRRARICRSSSVTFTDGTTGLVEGNAAATIGTHGTDPVTGKAYSAVLTGNAFINDMAQTATPFDASTGDALLADTDTGDRSGRPQSADRRQHGLRQRAAGRTLRRRRRPRERERRPDRHPGALPLRARPPAGADQDHDPAEPRRRRHLLRQRLGAAGRRR